MPVGGNLSFTSSNPLTVKSGKRAPREQRLFKVIDWREREGRIQTTSFNPAFLALYFQKCIFSSKIKATHVRGGRLRKHMGRPANRVLEDGGRQRH